MQLLESQTQKLDQNGLVLVPSVFTESQVLSLLNQIELAIDRGSDSNIKSSLGETYAARNLAEWEPQLLESWKTTQLVELLHQVLGAEVGLVRILYFDKHPNRTWSLPWHKDMTIAVRDNSLPSGVFSKPTRKSGVDHVEAPTDLLERMLTLRIHLDEVTKENGPLEVALGSHKQGKSAMEKTCVEQVICHAGDVLAMRPLLSHASGSSTPGTIRHRRILHLEFAGLQELPDGFAWHLFHNVSRR